MYTVDAQKWRLKFLGSVFSTLNNYDVKLLKIRILTTKYIKKKPKKKKTNIILINSLINSLTFNTIEILNINLNNI